MRWILNAILLAVLSGLGDCQYERPYDCRRRNSDCRNGRTCVTISAQAILLGTCSCSTAVTYPGYNCQLESAEINPSGCVGTQACQNGGTCYRPNTISPFRCFCAPAFMGNTCALRRVRILSCTGTAITAVINPNSNNFQGKIYVRGHPTQAACRFAVSGNPNNPGYLRQLSLDMTGGNPCSGTQSLNQTITEAGETKRTYYVYIQHHPTAQLFTDEMHTLSCIGAGPSATTSVTMGTVTNGGTNGGDTVDLTTGGFRLMLTSFPNRAQITGPVTIGQDLYLQATPTIPGSVADFRITSCTARGPSGSSMDLISNRCVTADGRLTGVTAFTKVGATMISLQFKAFKFDNDASMEIFCEFVTCASPSDLACQLTTCTGSQLSYGRRRRDADPEVKPNSTIRLYVVSSLEDKDDRVGQACKSVEQKTDEVCFNSAAVIGLATLFLFLLVVALLMLFFVCLRLRSRKSPEESISYTNNYASHENM